MPNIKKQLGYKIKTTSEDFRPSVFGFAVPGFTVSDIYFTPYVTTPIVSILPDVVLTACPIEIVCSSVTNTSEPINFRLEFWQLDNGAMISSYDTALAPYWNKNGYQSGELAFFNLNLVDDPALESYIETNRGVKMYMMAYNTFAMSGYTEGFELWFTEYTPYAPETIYGFDGEVLFKWVSFSDIPSIAHGLNYTLEIYSATEEASFMSTFSWLCDLNTSSYWSALSMLSVNSFLSLLLTQSAIAGQVSYTYWELFSQLGLGSYLARVGLYDDSISSMVWSLMEPFSTIQTGRYITFKPGFNLYSIPIYDLDANTARKLVEQKVGYQDAEENTPYISEIIKWKAGDEYLDNDKWESVVASKFGYGYELNGDYDIQHNEGYFINLNYHSPVTVEFKGIPWEVYNV